MFFFLSKIVGPWLLPTNFLIGAGLLGVALLATRYVRAGRRLMVFAILMLAIAGFSPLGNWLLYPLEQRFPPWDAARGAPYGIIVLGGSIDADLSAAHDGAVVRSAA
ncbi:MAG: YdcF family protein, partial [Bradyrhizobium sp.]|nr:YdcF family protein [Bradyrhizobium sp.]